MSPSIWPRTGSQPSQPSDADPSAVPADPERFVEQHPSGTADPAATQPQPGPWATYPEGTADAPEQASPEVLSGGPEDYASYPHEPGEDYTRTDAGLIGPADDDLDLLAERPKPGKLTYVLIGLIAAGLVFMGGVWAQKHFGSSTAARGGFAAAAGTGRAGGAEGFGAGGFGTGTRRSGEGFGAGGFTGGGAAGGFGGGTGAAAGTGTGAGPGAAGGTGGTASAVPVVVGTVTRISGTTMVVKNLGGKSVTVKVPTTATISIKVGSSLAGAGLKKGATVSVAGSTAASGEVTATSVSVTS